MSAKLSKRHHAFLCALVEHGRLSASTGNPPVMTLAKQGLITFVHRSEDFSVMEITEAGRAALQAGGRAEASEGVELAHELRASLMEMAHQCSVNMTLWDNFSNLVLMAADTLDTLSALQAGGQAGGVEARLESLAKDIEAAALLIGSAALNPHGAHDEATLARCEGMRVAASIVRDAAALSAPLPDRGEES